MRGLAPLGTEPPSASEEVARLRLRFRQFSLSDLEAQGAVHWDRNSNLVRKGERFYDKWAEDSLI